MTVDKTTSALETELTSSRNTRLKLVTLLSLYDLLPHSISRPPNAEEPLELDDAIDSENVRRILESLRETNRIPPSCPLANTTQRQSNASPPVMGTQSRSAKLDTSIHLSSDHDCSKRQTATKRV